MVSVLPVASAPLAASGDAILGFRRAQDSRALRELIRQESPEAYPCFLTITHEQLNEPIRVVSNPKNINYDGYLFQGFMFSFTLLSDTEGPPRCRVEIQNVDRRIGDTIKRIIGPPKLAMTVIPLSDFDTTVIPHSPISSPLPIWDAKHLFMIDITVTPTNVTGQIVSRAYTREQWPGLLATQPRTPGAFR